MSERLVGSARKFHERVVRVVPRYLQYGSAGWGLGGVVNGNWVDAGVGFALCAGSTLVVKLNNRSSDGPNSHRSGR